MHFYKLANQSNLHYLAYNQAKIQRSSIGCNEARDKGRKKKLENDGLIQRTNRAFIVNNTTKSQPSS